MVALIQISLNQTVERGYWVNALLRIGIEIKHPQKTALQLSHEHLPQWKSYYFFWTISSTAECSVNFIRLFEAQYLQSIIIDFSFIFLLGYMVVTSTDPWKSVCQLLLLFMK